MNFHLKLLKATAEFVLMLLLLEVVLLLWLINVHPGHLKANFQFLLWVCWWFVVCTVIFMCCVVVGVVTIL